MHSKPLLILSALVLAGLSTVSPAAARASVTNGEISFGRIDPALGAFTLWVAEPDGSHQHRLTSVPSFFSDWSPDGSRIAYDFAPSADEHIATISPDGRSNRQITFGPGIQEIPRWSPDGRRIVYDASPTLPEAPGFHTDIWIMHADGSGARQLTSGGFDGEPVFSPHGHQIAFGRITHDADVATVAIYAMHSDGTHLRQVVPPTLGLEHPDWSPNGRWITFNIAPEAPGAAVRAVHPDGTDLHTIRSSDDHFRLFKAVWSPDGRQFLVGCHDVRAGIDRLCVMNADGRHLHVVVAAPVPVNYPAWGPATSASDTDRTSP